MSNDDTAHEAHQRRLVSARCGATSAARRGPDAVREPGPPGARPPRWPTTTRRPPSGPSARSRRCSPSRCWRTLGFLVAYFAIARTRRRRRPRHRQRRAARTSCSAWRSASRLLGIGIGGGPLGQDPDARRRDRRGAPRAAQLRRRARARPPSTSSRAARLGQLGRASADQVHPDRRAGALRRSRSSSRSSATLGADRRRRARAHDLGHRGQPTVPARRSGSCATRS